MGQRKLLVDELQLGMYVSELDRPWLDTPFLFQGFPILSKQELMQLRQCCDYVFIDDELSVSINPEQVNAAPHGKPVKRFETRRINKPAAKHPASRGARRRFLEELPEAQDVYQNAHHYIHELFEDIREGRTIDVEQARALADRTVDSIMGNENALLWLTLLKRKDEYTSYHSINVCTLSVLFGSYLGLTDGELRMLGMGALLHDIGKMRVPLEILNKETALNAEEMITMRQHPEWGLAILDEAEGVPPQVREVVHAHHERVDGSGYPRGLSGDDIGLFPMIVSLVDVYDAMTSDRAYHERLSSHEVLNMMYGWGETVFKRELLEDFIRCLGIYPVGSLVELSSGEVALVMTVNRKYHLRPQVLLLLDAHKQPYEQPKLMNLELHEQSGLHIHITRILPSDAFDIDVRNVVMNNNPQSLELLS